MRRPLASPGGTPCVRRPVSSWGQPLRAPPRIVLEAAPACAAPYRHLGAAPACATPYRHLGAATACAAPYRHLGAAPACAAPYRPRGSPYVRRPVSSGGSPYVRRPISPYRHTFPRAKIFLRLWRAIRLTPVDRVDQKQKPKLGGLTEHNFWGGGVQETTRRPSTHLAYRGLARE